MRQVNNTEALVIMRNGGECKADVLTYFVREETLFYRDAKGIEHTSYTTVERFHANSNDRPWTVVKEPRCIHGNMGGCDICIAEDR